MFILGVGSNLLIDDNGVPGLVIKLSGNFKSISPIESSTIRLGAGLTLPSIAKKMAKDGHAGFEHWAGIPG